MSSTIERLPKGTIQLTMTIAWSNVKKTYDDLVTKYEKEVELPGFRKGKAPKQLAHDKLDTSKLYEEVIRILLPAVYNDAIKEHTLRPVVTPKIELKEAAEGKDWIVLAYTCQKPDLTLGEYRKAITDIKATKRNKIWTPGQGEKPEDKPEEQKATIDELLAVVYGTVTGDLPELLIEHEVNRLLADLIDQTKKLGLTVEQYLTSTNRTAEGLKKEYEVQATRTITLEFALEAIADKEGIFVSDDDIATVIKTAKSDEERKTLENQRYYLASILRRQKTLDFLSAL